MSRHNHTRRHRDRLVWGLILIAVGVIFLLQNVMNIEVWDYAWKFWPFILILWGAQKLIDGLQKPKDRNEPASPSAPKQD
jgi:uncharacterized integral membrane protein